MTWLYLHLESVRVVSCDPEFYGGRRVHGKYGVLHFGGSHLRNDLDAYKTLIMTNRKSHSANRMEPSAGVYGYGYRKCRKLGVEPVEFSRHYRVQRLGELSCKDCQFLLSLCLVPALYFCQPHNATVWLCTYMCSLRLCVFLDNNFRTKWVLDSYIWCILLLYLGNLPLKESDNSRLSQTDPRDALHHVRSMVHKAWQTSDRRQPIVDNT